jgi:predicted MFS family arabinose efflux permease
MPILSTAAAPSTPSPSPLSVPAFRALLLAQSCFGVAFSTFLILPKFLAVHLAAGPSQVGWIMATASLANVLTVRVVGSVSARYGGRRTLALASLFMAAGALGFAFVETVGPLAFLCRALQGMGWAFMFASSGALVLALAPPGRLSQAIALHGSANLVTNAIGPALAEPGIALVGPAPIFVAAALVSIVGAWLASRINAPRDSAGANPGRSPGRVSAAHPTETGAAALSTVTTASPPTPGARTPAAGTTAASAVPGREAVPVALLFLGVVVGIGCGTMLTFHQPLALERGIERISDFLVAYTLAAVGIRLALGRQLDGAGPARVALGSFLVYGAVVAAMVLLRPGTLAVFGALFGLAHGLFWPSFLAVVLQQTLHAADRHRALAWVNAAFNGGVVSVAALGLLAERAGFALVFVPVGVLVSASALCLRRFLPRPA